jgi:hypothetical protein
MPNAQLATIIVTIYSTVSIFALILISLAHGDTNLQQIFVVVDLQF